MRIYQGAPSARPLLLCAFLALVSAPARVRPAQAQPSETANACVGFQNAVGDKELVVHAGNDCERKLLCTLDYVVRCEDSQQKETSRLQKRARFELAAKGNADLTLSAASCKQGWAIDDLAWTCR